MVEAIFNKEQISIVTPEIVSFLKKRALDSSRKRFRLCLHQSIEHQTQEMLIVFHKNTFMPPHRHPVEKSESYHIVEGKMKVFLFNDFGQVIDEVILQEYAKQAPFLFRMANGAWHMPMPVSEWLIYHETYTGPFIKEQDVEFAPWAPAEENKEQVRQFLSRL